jgi:hypothetical protein
VREKTTQAKNQDLLSAIAALQDELKKLKQERQETLKKKDIWRQS